MLLLASNITLSKTFLLHDHTLESGFQIMVAMYWHSDSKVALGAYKDVMATVTQARFHLLYWSKALICLPLTVFISDSKLHDLAGASKLD